MATVQPAKEINELCEEQPSPVVTPDDFVPLVRAMMQRNHVKHCELARMTGYTESKISRILKGKSSVDNTTLMTIFRALDIDLMRAWLAMTRFNDWNLYFDLDVELIANLIDVLPASLIKARADTVRAQISLPGTMMLADRISEMIAINDRETEQRLRDRPIAGL